MMKQTVLKMGLGSLFDLKIIWCNALTKTVGCFLTTFSLEIRRFLTCLKLEGDTLPVLKSCILKNVGVFSIHLNIAYNESIPQRSKKKMRYEVKFPHPIYLSLRNAYDFPRREKGRESRKKGLDKLQEFHLNDDNE